MDTVKSILKGDKYIWGVYLMLCMISIVEMYSATSTLTFKIQDYLAPTIRHTLILFCGTIGVIIIHNFHYKWFKLIPVVLLPLSFILLVYAMFFGEEVNGAQRWLTICGIPLQPSELAKMAVVITVSFILAKKQVPGGVQPDTFKTILIIVSIFCMLILPENFSTSALLGLVCFCLMLIGRVELIKLFKLVAVLAGFVIVLFSISPYIPENTPVLDRIPTWRARILNFSHGNDVPEYAVKTNDKNYQVHHARIFTTGLLRFYLCDYHRRNGSCRRSCSNGSLSVPTHKSRNDCKKMYPGFSCIPDHGYCHDDRIPSYSQYVGRIGTHSRNRSASSFDKSRRNIDDHYLCLFRDHAKYQPICDPRRY